MEDAALFCCQVFRPCLSVAVLWRRWFKRLRRNGRVARARGARPGHTHTVLYGQDEPETIQVYWPLLQLFTYRQFASLPWPMWGTYVSEHLCWNICLFYPHMSPMYAICVFTLTSHRPYVRNICVGTSLSDHMRLYPLMGSMWGTYRNICVGTYRYDLDGLYIYTFQAQINMLLYKESCISQSICECIITCLSITSIYDMSTWGNPPSSQSTRDDFSGTLYVEMYNWNSMTPLKSWTVPFQVSIIRHIYWMRT